MLFEILFKIALALCEGVNRLMGWKQTKWGPQPKLLQFLQEIKLVVEVIHPLHALSVHGEMELLGVMVIVYGLMKNVF